MKKLAALFLALAALCSAAEVKKDIEYGTTDGVSLKLDASIPEGDGPFPVVILIHGGGWGSGDKAGSDKPGSGSDITPWFEPVTQGKFTWFSINYRLAPQYHWPACFDDVEMAIRWVKAHAAEYKGDPRRIALFGHSSGGHLATLAGLVRTPDLRVQAVVGFAPVTDVVEDSRVRGGMSPALQNLLDLPKEVTEESEHVLREISPINHVKAGAPPFLILHGDADKTVPMKQTLNFKARLEADHIPVELITLPGAPHGLLTWSKFDPEWPTKLVAWLNQTLAAPGEGGSTAAAAPPPTPRAIAAGPFKPNWESLTKNYQPPEWFRDAKFGIWAHWTAQCVPEQGDWYARKMYEQGTKFYDWHVEHYGHPSKFGFMEFDNLWKAEHWDPEKLISLYQKAGAKYFVALANHHDNFDAYDSRYQPWNSINVGPHKDIVGTWAKIARAHGLRFGVSNHSAHTWHWFQTAYGYDGEGPFAGVRYDAATLKKEDGIGKWWQGLDPQDLYGGPNMVIPDGITGAKAVAEWHLKNDRVWTEAPPPNNPAFVDKWFLRAQDLVDKYQPDLIYFDDEELPLGQAGLDIAAHIYNADLTRTGGKLDVVVNAKKMTAEHRAGVVEDIERGVATGILPAAWQTDTCIGGWHYERRLFEEHKYKTTAQVVRMLVDIVSKNGNLLLSVPMRSDGTIDADEVAFLEGMAKWMAINGDAIYATRPWKIYGEGPSTTESAEKGTFGGAKDVRAKPYTAEDIRFTTKAGALYAFLLEWPENGTALVKSLTPEAGKVTGVSLLGHDGKLEWTQDEHGLSVKLPAARPGEIAYALKIEGIVTP